jgi:hypothetical protein
MIIMAVLGGVIVVVLACTGWYGYRRRGRGARPSVAVNVRKLEALRTRRPIDEARVRDASPYRNSGGGI